MAGQVGNPVSLTGQTANISTATAYTPTTSGLYRVSAALAVTTVDAVSSTLPKCTIGWTNPDSNQAETADITATNAGNALTTTTTGQLIIKAKTAVAITYATASYASNTPATMAYDIDIRVEAM